MKGNMYQVGNKVIRPGPAQPDYNLIQGIISVYLKILCQSFSVFSVQGLILFHDFSARFLWPQIHIIVPTLIPFLI